MPALFEQQQGFVRALFSRPDSYEHLALRAAMGSSVARGMAIYRNNVFSNYQRMLSSLYPVIERLVGADFFAAVGHDYIQATPSCSGDIRNYGEQFAEFLAAHPHANALVYLKDVASIEWACHKVMHAPPQKVFSLAELHHLPQEQLGRMMFGLSAACQLISSPYPALTIWQANQPGYSGDENINLGSGGEYCLVLRHKLAVQPLALSTAEFEFLTRLSQRQTLGDALHAVQSLTTDFDLQNCLQRHISNGVISEFTFYQGA
ncbi:MAG TPA: DNA-binding domain-containing protein [Gallionella sp.]|nr:DNA-binding domain-containing protein [Gallionella sp.]